MNKPILKYFIILFLLIPALLQTVSGQEKEIPVMTLPENLLATLKKEHPRLHADAGVFEALKSDIKNDETLKTWYDNTVKRGDAILSEKPSIYEIPDGLRLFSTSRRVKERMYILGFLFQVTGEKKYAERAWAERISLPLADWK